MALWSIDDSFHDPAGIVQRVDENRGQAIDLVIGPGDDVALAVAKLSTNGGGRLQLQAGDYLLNSDLILQNNISITGESFGASVIVFDGAHSVVATGTNPYSTGTISVSPNGSVVTGLGTSWLSNLTDKHKIKLGSLPFQIATVDSDTQITLFETYFGAGLSNVAYEAAIYVERGELDNLVIKSPFSKGVNLTYTDLFKISNTLIQDCGDIGLSATHSLRLNVERTFLTNGEATGIVLNSVENSLLNFVEAADNNGNGIEANNCTLMGFDGCSAVDNTGDGWHLTNGTSIVLSGRNEGTSNGSNGFYLNTISNSAMAFDNANSNVGDGWHGENLILCTVTDGTANSNGGYGLSFFTSVNGLIRGVNASNNVIAGFRSTGGTENQILTNVTEGNPVGIKWGPKENKGIIIGHHATGSLIIDADSNNTFLAGNAFDSFVNNNGSTVAKANNGIPDLPSPTTVLNLIQLKRTPTEAPNGVITTFTAPDTYQRGSMLAFLNGLEEPITELSSTQIQFVEAPAGGDSLLLVYIAAAVSSVARLQLGISRITNTMPRSQASKADIAISIPRDQSSRAGIYKLATRTQTGKSNIDTTLTSYAIQTGVAQIIASTSQNQTGLANIG